MPAGSVVGATKSNSHLSLASVSSLRGVPNGAKVHFIGICGVAMGALALELSRRGYAVSGSDKEFYPPMSELLERSPIRLFRQFDGAQVPADAGLVVIGNSVPVSNPEVQRVEAERLPQTFFAALLGELLFEERRGIVVTGTHGKTTTTSLVAFGLASLAQDPAYFIGGEIPQLESSLTLGEGKLAVVEGDEYDCVFYVKRPKFLFYRPDILVINALEFDHADIYADLHQIEGEFEELIRRVPADGAVIACIDYPSVVGLLERTADRACRRVVTYGRTGSPHFRLASSTYRGEYQVGTIEHGVEHFEIETSLVGDFNLLNVLASMLAAEAAGIEREAWLQAIRDFRGVSRRLQPLLRRPELVLLEDFAHHPTAVHEVVTALRNRYPDAELWAAFEARSNTSRRAIFQRQYGSCFQGLDRLYLRQIETRHTDSEQKLLDLQQLKADIEQRGTLCIIGKDGKELSERILSDLAGRSPGRQVIFTIMSNGGFDGLPSLLKAGLGD